MGWTPKWLQRKVDAVSARRWEQVADRVAPGEQPVEQTRAYLVLPKGRLDGYLLLTTGALLVSVVEGPGSKESPFAIRIPLSDVTAIAVADDGKGLRVTSTSKKGPQYSEFSLYPSRSSARLADELVSRWKARS